MFSCGIVNMHGMIDLVIVDDHPVVRRGIKRILSCEDDISTLDEASNIDELLQLA